MAFSALTRSSAPRRRNRKPTVSIYTTEHRPNPGLVDVRIRLTRPLMEKLGWNEGQKVNVLAGYDEDAGSLLLEAHPTGVFQLKRSTPTASSFVITSRAIPLPVGINKKAPFTITDEGSLLVNFA